MKKILLIVALIAGAYQLKAQTMVKPLDSLQLKSPDTFNQLKPDNSPLMKQYFSLPPLQKAAPLMALAKQPDAIAFASRMPILKVSSDDKMPVAKVSSDDRMPVAKIKVIDPLLKQPLVTP
jgi:hypothetical protein